MPRRVHGAQESEHPRGAGIIEGDEQVKFPPPLSCDCHPSVDYALPDLCRTVAYRPGKISEVLTEHYRRIHPETLGLSYR
jgi:hypothetical protein